MTRERESKDEVKGTGDEIRRQLSAGICLPAPRRPGRWLALIEGVHKVHAGKYQIHLSNMIHKARVEEMDEDVLVRARKPVKNNH